MQQKLKSLNGFNPDAKLYSVQVPGDDVVFPEVNEGYVDGNGVGLAVSGGGSRSLAMTVGYLRGIHGLRTEHGLKQFDYMSGVSGGAWATAIYTFAEEPELVLLGPETEPDKLTLSVLDSASPGKMGEVISNNRFKAVKMLAKNFFWTGTSKSKLWSDMIAECLLSDFDLDNAMIAVNEAHLQSILARNKYLKSKKFRTITPGKPFPIINCTLLGPEGYSAGLCHTFQATPLYSGIPFYKNQDNSTYLKVNAFKKALAKYTPYTSRPETRVITVGGGFVETFAMNSSGPADVKKRYFDGTAQTSKSMKMQAIATSNLYTLGDMIGASSAAFGASMSNSGLGDELNATVNYFPIQSTIMDNLGYKQSAKKLQIADGALYENLGVLSLLQRGVKKIVCLLNTPTPLDLDCDLEKFVEVDYKVKPPVVKYKACCVDLLCLFGELPVVLGSGAGFNQSSNTVFRKSLLADVIKGLVENAKAGKGAVYRKVMEVLPNRAWNIAGGFDLDITFVYNSVVGEFMDKLPEDTRTAILDGDEGPFANFPFYKTVFQMKNPLALTLPQINLMTAQTEFIIKANADIFTSVLEDTPNQV